MQNALTSGCIFSLNCSNYLPNIVAACPHCTLGTELCTAYVTMHHVPFLSQAIHTSIHSSCHSSQRTWPSGICSCSLGMSSSNRFSQMLLHPIFLPQLLCKGTVHIFCSSSDSIVRQMCLLDCNAYCNLFFVLSLARQPPSGPRPPHS